MTTFKFYTARVYCYGFGMSDSFGFLVPLAVIGIAAGAYYWFMIRKTGDGKKGDKKSFLEMGGSSSLGVDTSAGAKFDDL